MFLDGVLSLQKKVFIEELQTIGPNAVPVLLRERSHMLEYLVHILELELACVFQTHHQAFKDFSLLLSCQLALQLFSEEVPNRI